MDEVVTKRIHISGLTPAITSKDLSDRLASFGTVKSIDGFGLLDALGQPRKFAYATIETTKGKLARCMNLLSGVTWKGAKLRLGDAKLDYRERIAKEHADLKRAAEEAEGAPPSKKRRRGVQGVHARDMSLVTPENVSTRGGWHVTPSGRLIRPMRMRPAHPLPEPLDIVKTSKGSKGKYMGKKEKKKRVRDPPTRARRKTIDPVRWGSQQLKGIFLENAAASVSGQPFQVPEIAPHEHAEESSDSESEESDIEQQDSEVETDDSDELQAPPPLPANLAPARPATAPVTAQKTSAATSAISHDFAAEMNHSLGLLHSLFGDKEEWGGSESVGSDSEDDAQLEGRSTLPVEAMAPATADVMESAMEVDEQEPEVEEAHSLRQERPVPKVEGPRTKLRDLFAPREEDAGFSLLGHLDLDLELEDDIPFEVLAPVPPSASTTSRPLASIQALVTHAPYVASLDLSRSFFFPGDPAGAKRSAHDPTNWRTWFYRTDSPEAIRARWEETKGELTAGWKRRHREAIKSRRRRGGGTGEAD